MIPAVPPTTVFAVWYVKGCYEDILNQIMGLCISASILVDQGDQDEYIGEWQQCEGYFPDEGKVTIERMTASNNPPRWKITLEVKDETLWREYGPHNYSLSPAMLVPDDSWDETFTHPKHGEAADWGLR